MARSDMREYYARVVAHGWGAVLTHGRTTLLAVVGAIVSVLALAAFQINPPNQTLLRSMAGIAWPLLLLIGYFLFYVLRAPWKLHQEEANIIQELRDRQRDPLFYPYPDRKGRHLDAAMWGSAKKKPLDVTERVIEHFRQGRDHVPVNNDNLCPGQDPDEGEDDKYLTITFTETLKQRDKLSLPFQWLGVNDLNFDVPASVICDFNELSFPYRLALSRVLASRSGMSDKSLIQFLAQKGIAAPDEIVEELCKRTTLIEKDGYGRISVKVHVFGTLGKLFIREPLSSSLS
jgi:hypothetical protein